MGMIGAVRTCFANYVAFSGRARRPEFWWFALFIFLGTLVAGALDLALFGTGESMRMESETGMAMSARVSGPDPIGTIFTLGVLLPSLAVGWRRMHDTGRSGWWLLLPFAVSVGAMALGAILAGGPMLMMEQGAMPRPMWGGLGLLGALVMFGAPLVAYVLVIVWLASPTQPGSNEYGAEPPAA